MNTSCKTSMRQAGNICTLFRLVAIAFRPHRVEESTIPWKMGVDYITRGRLGAMEDNKQRSTVGGTFRRELLQGLGGFPFIKHAVVDVPALTDPDFIAGIRRHAENLVQCSRDVSNISRGPRLMARRTSGLGHRMITTTYSVPDELQGVFLTPSLYGTYPSVTQSMSHSKAPNLVSDSSFILQLLDTTSK
ncbi:hypothetical protein BJV78DRAFT_959393 [Lactifluus subvellereus]|nr:hypothetical protein BJV78DRAFT_959393 [Lactifluus subvellereus]